MDRMVFYFSGIQLYYGIALSRTVSLLSPIWSVDAKPLEKLRMKIANSTGSALSWIMCIVGFLLILNSPDYL